MKKIKPTKGKALDIKVDAELIEQIIDHGGEFELEAGIDFTCSASAASKYVREEIRARMGYAVFSQMKEGNIRVRMMPGR